MPGAGMNSALTKKLAADAKKNGKASPDAYLSKNQFLKKEVKRGVTNFKTGVKIVGGAAKNIGNKIAKGAAAKNTFRGVSIPKKR